MKLSRIKNRDWIMWGVLGAFLYLLACPAVCDWIREVAVKGGSHACCAVSEKSDVPAAQGRCCEQGHPQLLISKSDSGLALAPVSLPVWWVVSPLPPEIFLATSLNNRAPPAIAKGSAVYLLNEVLLV